MEQQEETTVVSPEVQADVAVASKLTEVELLEKSMDEARKISSFRLKTLSQLIGVYLDSFSAEMIATNKNTYNEKVQAAKALKEAVLFALDFAVNVTKADIREKGKLSKEVNGLAGTLVQAMDTRFLLLADNMKRQQDADEKAQASAEVTQTNEETKET